MEAYKNNWEYISEELRRLDLLLHIQVAQSRKQFQQEEYEFAKIPFKGLVISDEEIDELISDSLEEKSDDIEVKKLAYKLSETEANIRERRELSLKSRNYLSLPYLSYLFGLSPFDEQVILICLAPELDRKYGQLYAYLQDDVTKKKPTVDFIFSLLCHTSEERNVARSAFSNDSPLLKYKIVHFSTELSDQSTYLLACPLKLDSHIVNFILGIHQFDEKISFFAELIQPDIVFDRVQVSDELRSRLGSLTEWYLRSQEKKKLIYLFYGSYGTGKKEAAEALCNELQIKLIVADISEMLGGQISFSEAVWLLFREGLLLSSAVYIEGFARLLDTDQRHSNIMSLTKAVEEFSFLTFLDSDSLWEPAGEFKQNLFIVVEFPVPDYDQRKTWWDDALTGLSSVADRIDTSELANRFRLSNGQIQDAVIKARNLALWRDAGDAKILMEDLYAACRSKSNQNLRRLAQKIIPMYTWEDIILQKEQKDQLLEICNYVRYRYIVYGEWGFEKKRSLGRGLNVLFSGPSGTGKTMAAEIISGDLQLDLYKIDLSQVVSKYIGETEKNLNNIFTEAQTSNAILFFDEADALFGKRSEVKDAHDRYANIEIGYLLQKMEEYEGVTILATNLRKNMDEAFVRRLHYSVEFPPPDIDERRRIWEIAFPSESPRSMDIDFNYLSRQFKVTGGNIKNIALSAAFLAANDGFTISMKHIIHATKREFQKMGKLCTEEDFGKYYHLITIET